MNNYIQQGKTISINALPDCEHKTNMLAIAKSGDAKICVIAHVVGNLMPADWWGKPVDPAVIVKWQCKAGYPSEEDLKPLQFVLPSQYLNVVILSSNEGILDYGVVLPEETAIILFPEWKGREYIPPTIEV